MNRIFIAALVGLVVSGPAWAEIVARCGELQGYAYYYPGLIVKQKDMGFTDDKISGGSITITNINGEYDVIYTDLSRSNMSSRADGAQIIVLGNNKVHLSLLVVYPGATGEIYSYHRPSNTMTLLQHKFRGAITASKLMVAECY
jgi:hypothetical protein